MYQVSLYNITSSQKPGMGVRPSSGTVKTVAILDVIIIIKHVISWEGNRVFSYTALHHLLDKSSYNSGAGLAK